MFFLKRGSQRVKRLLKKKVVQHTGNHFDVRYSQSWFNGVYEKISQDKKYQDFLFSYKLRNFNSASALAQSFDYNSLTTLEKLIVVKCYYSSKYGVIADQLLDKICEEVFSAEDPPNAKVIVNLLDRVRLSGYDFEGKLEIFEKGKSFLTLDDLREAEIYYSVLWMEYSLKNQKYGNVDPKPYIKDEHVSKFGVDLIYRFIPALRSYGHLHYVDRLLEEMLLKQEQTYCSLKVLTALCKERLSEIDAQKINVPIEEESIRFLPVFYAGREFSGVLSDMYSKLFGFLEKNFRSIGVHSQDIFLRFMLKNEMYHDILSVAKGGSYSNYLLPVFVAKGYVGIYQSDYYSARNCFEIALNEDPADALAATGLRFALPRTGREMKEILRLRDKVGYGIHSNGRVGFRDFGSELTISLLMSGDYIKGQYSKSKSKHWLVLKEAFGEKFLNFERLEKNARKDIFIIGDEGVGDEIRTSQFYDSLSSMYSNVTITCDPRLYNIFKNSFPEITFLPVARLWKLVETSGSKPEPRFDGYGDKISSYLTEECRPYIDKSDTLTFGQNVFFNYFLGAIKRPEPGAYLDLPQTSNMERGWSEKFKVGILWRSHLRVGARKMMYLDLEDFAPIFNLDGVELWSIQHSMDEDEIEFCRKKGINIISDVDTFNDFEGLGGYLKGLDLLVGVSSVPMELGAALGIETWMLGFSPENYYLRTAGGTDSYDRLTLNSSVIAPPWIDFSNPRDVCVQQVFEEVTRLLKIKIEGDVNEKAAE
ncbi:hypothetical protein V6R97_12185 [Chromohalobacter salexigens]|uniref:hypothetical protein n=1 Tax=Chromohalobacter israelensis TaxID=141390 RepID=UPI0032E8CA53